MTRFGRAWTIPKNAEKPSDNRIKPGKYIKIKVDIAAIFKGQL